MADEALDGIASSAVSATSRLHVQIPASTPQSKLVAVMRADNPSLLVPAGENVTPSANVRYDYTDYELADVSGHGREVLLNGSLGFSTAGGNMNTRSPVPRLPSWGIPLASWSGYPAPNIRTDLGPADFVVSSAWAVECWYRRYYYQADYYHFYFGNAVAYRPLLHHIYVAQGWFEIAGIRRKRALYTLGDTDGASHHLVLTYDGSGTTTLYFDGSAVETLSYSLAALNMQIDAAARLCFGTNGTDIFTTYAPYPAQCTYSHMAFYPSHLSADRVLAHYQTGISSASPLWLTPHPTFKLVRQEHR